MHYSTLITQKQVSIFFRRWLEAVHDQCHVAVVHSDSDGAFIRRCEEAHIAYLHAELEKAQASRRVRSVTLRPEREM